MTCAFFSLLTLIGGVISLVYLGWLRVARHLANQPVETRKMFVEHVVAPMLLGVKEPEEEPEK